MILKLIIVGINKVGDSLVNFAPDLNNRIDTIRFEANPDEKVRSLFEQGEAALNVEITIKNDVVRAASGSFYVAQMLCHETSIAAGVTECQPERGGIKDPDWQEPQPKEEEENGDAAWNHDWTL